MALLRGKQGFSLLELLIVITLIAIMTAIAITSIANTMPNLRLSAAARRVMTDLMLARMKAVSINKPINTTFAAGQYTIDPPGQTTTIGTEFKGVTLSSSGNVTFLPYGTSSASITVTLTGQSGLSPKYVDVSAAGRIRIR